METKKRDFEIKIAKLLEKKTLTAEDKAFLKARKAYIPKDVYKELGLDEKKAKKEDKKEEKKEASKKEE